VKHDTSQLAGDMSRKGQTHACGMSAQMER